jgi:hypothetical protein
MNTAKLERDVVSLTRSGQQKARVQQPTAHFGIGTKMQISLKTALAAVVFLSLGSGAALARHPCHNDAMKFCRNVVPDHRLIQHCLERNMFHLTRACKAQFR